VFDKLKVSKQACLGIIMDFIFIGASIALLLLSGALIMGCAKLGERQ